MTRTPASLLERLRQPGAAQAWERFVTLYTPLLFTWARRAGLGENDAADLVQEVFITLLRVLPDFHYDSRQSFRSWLRTLTMNHWRDLCRRRGTRQLPGGEGLENVAAADGLESLWEEEYRRQVAARALRVMQADFEPTTWRACWEFVANGRPAAEVAADLGLSVGAVHAARFRVLGRLREELRGLLD